MMAQRVVDDSLDLQWRLKLLERFVALRAQGLIEPLWVDEWVIYRRLDALDYPKSRERISWDELAAMIAAAEIERRPVGREMLPPARLGKAV